MLLKGLMFLFKMLQKQLYTLFAVAFLYFFSVARKSSEQDRELHAVSKL